jgi:5-methylcytosine-specific restriction enzyme subunit McrC
MASLMAYEYDTLRLCQQGQTLGRRCLTPGQWEHLSALSEQLPARALHPGYRNIKLGNFCGVVPMGADTLEILPKIYRSDAEAPANRAMMLHMLTVCRSLPLFESGPSSLALQNHQLLDIFIDQFCSAMFRQVRRGLIRVYQQQQENLRVLRGRINWQRQLHDNLVHQERIFCNFDELVEDNPYNQAIKATLSLVQRLCRSNLILQRKLRKLAFIFADVSRCPVMANDVAALPRNRLTQRYENILKWCEWFLRLRSPDLKGGSEDATGLLFDMNLLFENYIFRTIEHIVRSHAEFRHLRVTAQRPVRYLMRKHSPASNDKQYFQMRPDIVITRRGNPTPIAIIDTKWKLLSRIEAGNKWGIKQADVYQMFAYAKRYNCPRIILLYPAHAGIQEERMPQFMFNEAIEDAPTSLLQIESVTLEAGVSGNNPETRNQLIQLLASLRVNSKNRA